MHARCSVVNFEYIGRILTEIFWFGGNQSSMLLDQKIAVCMAKYGKKSVCRGRHRPTGNGNMAGTGYFDLLAPTSYSTANTLAHCKSTKHDCEYERSLTDML